MSTYWYVPVYWDVPVEAIPMWKTHPPSIDENVVRDVRGLRIRGPRDDECPIVADGSAIVSCL